MSDTGFDRLDWHSLIGPENAMTAEVGDYHATVEQMAAYGPEKFEWRIARSASAVDVHAPGFSNAIFEPVAEGRAPTLAEGIARAEEAAAALIVDPPVMTPEESAAYLAAHPEFAARVAAHARELAMERGIITRWPGIDPWGDLGWRRMPAHQALLARAVEYDVALRLREPYTWWVLRCDPFEDGFTTPDASFAAQGTAASFDDGMAHIAAALDELGVTPAQLAAAEEATSRTTVADPTTAVSRAFPAGPTSGGSTVRAAAANDLGGARFQPGRGR